MPKLCKCGAIVEKRCLRCYPVKHDKTTAQRGYGYDHKRASERYRTEHPLCEYCVMRGGVIGARSTTAMHHVTRIADDPTQRMRRDNWLAVCEECHQELESNVSEGRRVKKWSELNYEDAMCGGGG